MALARRLSFSIERLSEFRQLVSQGAGYFNPMSILASQGAGYCQPYVNPRMSALCQSSHHACFGLKRSHSDSSGSCQSAPESKEVPQEKTLIDQHRTSDARCSAEPGTTQRRHWHARHPRPATKLRRRAPRSRRPNPQLPGSRYATHEESKNRYRLATEPRQESREGLEVGALGNSHLSRSRT